MSDIDIDNNPNNTAAPTEIVVEDSPKLSSDDHKSAGNLDDLAKRYGWNPEGEKSAEEFIEFALKEVPERGKELKRIKRTVDDLKNHMSKQQEYAMKQAMEDLEAKKRLAKDNNDVITYNNLDREQQKLVPVDKSIQDAYNEFEDKNSDWLDIDNIETLEMRNWMLQRDNELGRKKMAPHDHFEALNRDIRKKFASYFDGESKPRLQAVESDGYNSVTPKKPSKKPSFSSLSKEHQETAENFARMGIMTKEQYLNDLIKHGEI